MSEDVLRHAALPGASLESHVAHLRGRVEPVLARAPRHAEADAAAVLYSVAANAREV